MPVLYNAESGLAENLPDKDAQSATKSGTHEVPLVSPEGELGSIPAQDVQAALASGYKQPDEKQLAGALEHAHYNSGTEQAKTFVEGAANAATFGLSGLAEDAILGNEKERAKRQEYNPGIHSVGEVAGLGASALTGLGAAPLMERAGAAVAEKVAPLLGKGILSSIGSKAAAGAVENMLYQTGSEAEKHFWRNPDSIESAIANVGLAGVLGATVGGGLGAAKELWAMGPGKKLGTLLEDLKAGSTGEEIVPEQAKKVYDPFTKKFTDADVPELQSMQSERYNPFTKKFEAAASKEADALATPVEEQHARPLKALGEHVLENLPDAAGLIGLAFGHGYLGYAIGKAAKLAGVGMPDAVKMAAMKFIASAEQVSAPGFRAAAEVAGAVLKGESKLNKAAMAVFDSSAPVVIAHSNEDFTRMQKRIDELQNDPSQALSIGGETGHYLPDHAAALAYTSTRAVQYLKSIQPQDTPNGILGTPLKPNVVADAKYQRALQLANNPLLILQGVKQGTLTPADMTHVQALYPGLLANMQQKVQQQLIEAKDKGVLVPYATQNAMSIFLKQPMNVSMQPNTIIASQPVPQPPVMQQMPKVKPTATGMKELGKLPNNYQTQTQHREANRTSRH